MSYSIVRWSSETCTSVYAPGYSALSPPTQTTPRCVLQLPLSLSHTGLVLNHSRVYRQLVATAVSQRPLHRQNEPEEVHPNGHVPFGAFGTASWAPCDGTQYEPLVK
jgi:hypothetical protein